MRALFVPLVHDEVATFFWYIHPESFLPFEAHWDSNNHFLNSLLTYIFYKLFGAEEIVLRLPSLLFALLFFYYLFKIARLINNNFLRWIFILSLILSHYFIEFFGMSRGYGISMALLFGGLWYFIRLFRKVRIKELLLCLIFMTLSCLANLTLINTFIIIIVLIILRITIFERGKFILKIKLLSIVTLIGIIPLAFISCYIFSLKSKGLLYYGLPDSFWEVTVRTLSKYFTGTESIIPLIFIAFYFALIIAGLAFLLINKYWKKRITEAFSLFSILLLGNIIASILLNKLFSVNYPEDRAGLYFYPLFISSLIFIFDSLQSRFPKKAIYALLLPLLFIPVHFFININLTHDLFFRDQRLPVSYYKKIKENHTAGDYPPTIQANAMRFFIWQYYNFMDGGKEGKVQYKEHPHYKEADFIIVRPENNPEWTDYYDTLDYDSPSELCLMKRKNILKKQLLFSTHTSADTVKYTDKTYKGLYKGSVDSLKSESLYVGIELDIESKHKPLIVNVVAEIRNEQNRFIKYRSLELDWFGTEWKEGDIFKNGVIFRELPEDSRSIKIYLWNRKNQEYCLNKYKIEIFKLVENNYIRINLINLVNSLKVCKQEKK